MREHKNIKEELKEISPFLATLKGQSEGFKTPSGYFDTLENNIFARIKAEEEVESWGNAASDTALADKQLGWFAKVKTWLWRPQVGIGFAMLLVIAFGANILMTSSAETNTELASDEVHEYIQENIEQFSQSLIMEVMTDDLAEVELTPTIDATEDELEDYIQENLIEDLDNEIIEEFL